MPRALPEAPVFLSWRQLHRSSPRVAGLLCLSIDIKLYILIDPSGQWRGVFRTLNSRICLFCFHELMQICKHLHLCFIVILFLCDTDIFFCSNLPLNV